MANDTSRLSPPAPPSPPARPGSPASRAGSGTTVLLFARPRDRRSSPSTSSSPRAGATPRASAPATCRSSRRRAGSARPGRARSRWRTSPARCPSSSPSPSATRPSPPRSTPARGPRRPRLRAAPRPAELLRRDAVLGQERPARRALGGPMAATDRLRLAQPAGRARPRHPRRGGGPGALPRVRGPDGAAPHAGGGDVLRDDGEERAEARRGAARPAALASSATPRAG